MQRGKTRTLEPMPAETPQAVREEIIDEEHLRLLTIGHYITGGLCIAFASIFIFHFVFIALMAANPEFFPTPHGEQVVAPDGVMRIFAVVIGLFILAGWLAGGLTIYMGRCIKLRTRRTLTFVVACLNMLFIPVGTVLGVFTLIVLSRPSVKRLYGL
jgi:hypothetical protein